MRQRWMLAVVFALLVPFALVATAEDDSSGLTTLRLPTGDAAAGRAAFQTLGCPTCHRVEGEKEFAQPVSANPGPTLGAYLHEQTDAQVAMSIFDPSHDILATVRGSTEDHMSPMGDFTEAITVGQFMDLVAYLRSIRH